MANDVSKSWFAVFNNPAERGYTGPPDVICNRLKAEWCVTDTRSGAWAYCIKHYCGHYPVYDDEGKFITYQLAVTDEQKAKIPPDLHHIHMVLEDTTTMRFSVVKNTYAIGMHFEGTKGNKKEAEDYISKTGAYSEAEKREAGLPWEEVIYVARYGEIRGKQGQRSDIQNIAKMIDEGSNPKEILSHSFGYYRYNTMIKQAYFDRRERLTPAVRDVKVIWHTGESGAGKSLSRMALIGEVGEHNVYYLTDYSTAMFDGYAGEPYLWMEDFKGEIRFGDLLRYLDVYKADLHARYANAKALWNEVHITSIFHPLGAYQKMLRYKKDQEEDKAAQLLRRISCIRYHYKQGQTLCFADFPVNVTVEHMRQFMAALFEVPGTWERISSDADIQGYSPFIRCPFSEIHLHKVRKLELNRQTSADLEKTETERIEQNDENTGAGDGKAEVVADEAQEQGS